MLIRVHLLEQPEGDWRIWGSAGPSFRERGSLELRIEGAAERGPMTSWIRDGYWVTHFSVPVAGGKPVEGTMYIATLAGFLKGVQVYRSVPPPKPLDSWSARALECMELMESDRNLSSKLYVACNFIEEPAGTSQK